MTDRQLTDFMRTLPAVVLAVLVGLAGHLWAEVGARTTAHTVTATPVAVGSASGRWMLELRTLDTTGTLLCGPVADPAAAWAPVTATLPLHAGTSVGYHGRSLAEQPWQCKTAGASIVVWAVEQGDLPPRTPAPTAQPTWTAAATATFTRTFTPKATHTPIPTATRTATP